MQAKTIFIFFTCLIFLKASTQPSRFDVLITEIMADPSPQVGLPSAEYVEIKNVSASAFQLNGWKLSDASSTATISASFIIQPDSIVILCANSQVAALSIYGRTIGVSGFPSLDNESDLLTIRSPQGTVIHAVEYQSAWHPNSVKKDGGWSLEMIDVHNPCAGAGNWAASTDPAGGTPGRKNSVDGINTDSDSPQLLRTYSIDSLTVVAVFDEALDSLSAAMANYMLSGNIQVVQATPESPLFNKVVLTLATPLQKRTVYMLRVDNASDCSNNSIGAFNEAKAGLGEDAAEMDLVVNEILFNPKPGGFDFIELYNKSNRIFDASKIFIANRNAAGDIANARRLSEKPFYIFPSDYIVATEDANALQLNYFVQDPSAIMELPSLPSFPDDKGVVVLTNSQGIILDEVAYSEKWHFALVGNAEGVSLERIEASARSGDPANWHSASSTSGFGTPTSKNSQSAASASFNGTIEVSPQVFSPDNDGRDDVAMIIYKMQQAGFVANITVFDSQGRMVRLLVKNGLMGLEGNWKWEGLDEQRRQLPQGIYIVLVELFNLEGKKIMFKKAIVLGGRLD
jgi:hypothetical protein